MRHPGCLGILAFILVVGISGCSALPGFGPREEISACSTPLAEMPVSARLALDELTVDGEIRTLQQRKVNGEIVYHVEACVGGRDVRYDIAGDGRHSPG